ncbi:MAG TPA: SRPBCC domain-containing protein [Mycobacterium sp.]|uniref:SRPBCC domain-containing protein n=1 Tax=Mycobacterium sp. TaxID=1785 RepID=UPI002C64E1BE|nr:SRPBCC domain-containing protein [Mycobacterium sp.]HME79801.1 SRPBCC domain-containing protein [Mycobacterium sp.]
MTVLRPRHRRGGTHTQSGSISITAPPETVWELITTLDTICEWYDTWDTVQHDTTDPRLRVGTTFRLIRHRRGRDDIAECRVTDITAPTGLQWEQSSPHTPTTAVSFRLIPGHDIGTTELEHTRTWTTP